MSIKSPESPDVPAYEKEKVPSPAVLDVETEHGRLEELEVDLDKAVHEDEPIDIESDHSPYPEV